MKTYIYICFFYDKDLFIAYTSTGDIMNLKKIKIISFFGVFLLTFLFHYLYEWFPNPFFAVLFPVNESIWEHMKLLYSGFFFWNIIEYLLIRKYSIKINNYILNTFIVMISSIIVYLIVYLPLYDVIGESMILAIGLLAIIIALSELFGFYLLKMERQDSPLNKASIVLIILGYIVLASLTFNPIKNYIFYDTHNHKYGIDIYEKD